MAIAAAATQKQQEADIVVLTATIRDASGELGHIRTQEHTACEVTQPRSNEGLQAQ